MPFAVVLDSDGYSPLQALINRGRRKTLVLIAGPSQDQETSLVM